MSSTRRSPPPLYSQLEVSPGTQTRSVAREEQVDLLRDVLNAQERTNELLEDLVATMATQQKQRASELHQWRNAHPTPAECLSAPYSNNAIPQQQLPAGVWLCVRTSNNNVGRIFVANIAGIPGLPLPMTMFLDHTTWSAGPGPGPGPDPGPGPGPSGDVYSAKTLAVKQTFAFDLDEGAIGSGPGADVWFQAVNPVQLFLQPTNGAQFAVGDRSNRGYEGCSNESFSPAKVALNTLPAGSYVCAGTSDGRVSQFRLTAISPGSPKTLTIKTTTWE